jgi:hypothetical protein
VSIPLLVALVGSVFISKIVYLIVTSCTSAFLRNEQGNAGSLVA